MKLSRIDYLIGLPLTTEELEVAAIVQKIIDTMQRKPDTSGEKKLELAIQAVLNCYHSSAEAEQIDCVLSVLYELAQVHYSLQELLHLLEQVRCGSGIRIALLEIEKSPRVIQIINRIV